MLLTSEIPRLEPIAYLQAQTGAEVEWEKLQTHELAAKRLHETYDIVPTIGCEVEVKWSSLFPDLARQYFGEQDELGRFERKYADLPLDQQEALDAACVPLDAELKPKFEATKAAGIPQGKDAYWEFANAPTYAWQTLSQEVALLMDHGLIPPGNNHSLHVTVGGVNSLGGGPNLVLAGLELAFVPPERIILATYGNKLGTNSSWARRGQDGLSARSAGMLALGQHQASEFRTLVAETPENVSQTLFTAQSLSSILLAFRRRHELPQEPVQELACLWPQYRKILMNVWEERGLPVSSWGSPVKNPEPWLGWAECLSRRHEESSIEAAAVIAIDKVCDKAEQLLAAL